MQLAPRPVALALLLLLLCPTASSQEDGVRPSGNPSYFFVSYEKGRVWKKGERVCVTHGQRVALCGTVVATLPSEAMVRIERPPDPQPAERAVSSLPVPASAWRFGLEVGTNLANASITTAAKPSTSLRPGGIFGPIAERPLTDSFRINVAAVYIEKGPNFTQGATTGVDRLDYIEVSPQLMFALPLSLPIPLYVCGGPFFGYLINGTVQTTTGGSSQEQSLSGTVSKIDFGLDLGMAATYPLSEAIQLRGVVQFALGMSNLASTPGDSWHSRGILFLGGALFAL